MDSVTVTLALLGICSLLYFLYGVLRAPTKFPEGPRGWRSYMAIWRATKEWKFHLLSNDWARRFGDVTGLRLLGGKNMIIINNPALAHQLYVTGPHSRDLVHRPSTFVGKYVFYDEKGAYFTHFDDIARQKYRLLEEVFDVSGGKGMLSEKALDEELGHLCQQLSDSAGKDAPLHQLITVSLKNLIHIVVLGERTKPEMDDDLLFSFDRNLNMLVSAEVRMALDMMPSLRHMPGMFRKLWRATQTSQRRAENLAFYSQIPNHHPDNLKGLTDVLLSVKDKPEYNWMDNEHMCALILTVFTCSHLTSLGYLLSLFLVLIHHPEVQRRIQREVDEVVGRGRRPRVDDRPSMPYTEATVLEIFRYASNLPLTAGRKATKEMELTDFGLTIPKDTSIIINAWYIHHDERIFTDPWAFNPERFLDSHGRLLPPTDPKRIAVNNFGLGERMCPASDFAESRFFLYVTTLLQKFDLDPPTKREQLPSCDPRTYCPGTILQPRVFSTKITKRVN